jgi:hypothetical protein
MKSFVLPVIVSLMAAMPVHAAESAFVWQLPEGWKMTVEAEQQFHTFSIASGDGVMMFSKWPAPTKPKEIPKTLKVMADKFPELLKGRGGALKKDEAEIGEIKGSLFQGSFALFELKAPAEGVQTMFMVHDGKGGVFNGQFTGSAKAWEKGLELVKTTKLK